MPAYNFKQCFADLILSGQKRQTIRADRKDGRVPKVGEPFIAYTGMRTKDCEKLCTGTTIRVRRVHMNSRGAIYVEGIPLTPGGIQTMAELDGFDFADDFLNFFERTHGFPFAGHVINWQ